MRTTCLSLILSAAVTAFAQIPKNTPVDTCAIPDQSVAVTRCEVSSIYVADFDRAVIEEILNRHFDGFTILPARGCWRKICESSVVIQIAGAQESELRKVAEELRVAGKQQSVLVVIPASPAAAPRRVRHAP